MSNYDKILSYAKEKNGYITAEEVCKLGVNSTFLSNLVNDKKLEKVGYGIYKLPEFPLIIFIFCLKVVYICVFLMLLVYNYII